MAEKSINQTGMFVFFVDFSVVFAGRCSPFSFSKSRNYPFRQMFSGKSENSEFLCLQFLVVYAKILLLCEPEGFVI